MAVPYSKPKLIYEGFVDGFMRVGRRDYIPISSIILVLHHRGKLTNNLKKMYAAKGRFINTAREEKVRSMLIVGLKGDSFCLSSPLDPVVLMRYITRWRLGKEVKDEDPWNGLREAYGDPRSERYKALVSRTHRAKVEGVAGEDSTTEDLDSASTEDVSAPCADSGGASLCEEPKDV